VGFATALPTLLRKLSVDDCSAIFLGWTRARPFFVGGRLLGHFIEICRENGGVRLENGGFRYRSTHPTRPFLGWTTARPFFWDGQEYGHFLWNPSGLGVPKLKIIFRSGQFVE